jgi:adhesin transport system outer membrane protein
MRNRKIKPLKLSRLTLLCLLINCIVANGETLPRFVEKVLADNPQIESAISELNAQSATVNRRLGRFFPTVNGNVARGTEKTQIGDSTQTLSTRESSLSVLQDLFRGGENYYNYQASNFTRSARMQDLRETTQNVALNAIRAYNNILRYEKLIHYAQNNIKQHENVLNGMKLRLKHQAGRRGEVQLAQARLSLAQSKKDQFVNQLNRARYEYRQVSGQTPPKHLTPSIVPDTDMPNSLREAINMALEHNPRLQSSQQRLKARQASEKVARAKFMPTITAEARSNIRDNINGIEGRNNSHSARIMLNYDLFKGGSDWANWNNASYQTSRVMHDVDNTRRENIKSVSRTWSGIKTSMNRIERFKQYVQSSAQVARDYRKQFRVGRRPLFNVLDAEREQFRARVSYVNSRYNYIIRSYQLLADIGTLIPVLNKMK